MATAALPPSSSTAFRSFSIPAGGLAVCESMPATIANILCDANKSCGDEQKTFAYLGRVRKKKSTGKHSRSDVGQLFKQAREVKGLSQLDVAEQLGMTRQGYAHYELGSALPPADDLSALAEILDLDFGILSKPKSAVLAFPPTDDPLLQYLHRLWSAMNSDDRQAIIETAEGRLSRRGIQIDQFNQRDRAAKKVANGE